MVGLTGWSWHTGNERGSPAEVVTDPLLETPAEIGYLHPITITKDRHNKVHALSAVELPDGSLRAYWFGGSREGGRDVSIWTSAWEEGGGTWSVPTVAVERLWLERETGQNIRKLGNPVAHITETGGVELFVVGVAMGGWSGSSLYHLYSEDDGVTFGSPRRLVTSPFLNISTLVKGPIMDLDDGGLTIPAYHEFLSYYPLLIRLDAERHVVGMESLREAEGLIQPWVVHLAEEREVYCRDMTEEGMVHVVSGDGVRALDIPNPNSAVAALRVEDGTLLVCNDMDRSEDDPSRGRNKLSLFFRPNGDHDWRKIREVEGSEADNREEHDPAIRSSYPWLMQGQDGTIHLLYSWKSGHLRHARFDAKEWRTP